VFLERCVLSGFFFTVFVEIHQLNWKSMLWKTERYSKFQSEANWPCYYRKISETSENAELKKTQPEMKKENHANQKTKPLFKHVSF